MGIPAFTQAAGLNRAFLRVGYVRTRLARRPHGSRHGYSQFNCHAFCAYVHQKAPQAAQRMKMHTSPKTVLQDISITRVESILEHKFKDRSLLAQALSHRSLINNNFKRCDLMYETDKGHFREIEANNERLELLGDRVYGLLVMEGLYNHHATKTEGQLSTLSHFLLSRDQAHKFCEQLGLDQFLLQAKELRGQKGSRYGDMFEALLGALFLDGGYDAALRFFQSQILPIWEVESLGRKTYMCKKQELQEYLVKQGLPGMALGTRFKYIEIRGDYVKQTFTQGIELFGRRVSIASAKTRAAADQAAASQLLSNLKKSKVTCFLIRLARDANDHDSLAKLQAIRAEQVRADSSKALCESPSR